MISLEFNERAIPAALKPFPSWVNWRIGTRDAKPTKLPLNPRTGAMAASDNPATWSTFDRAVEAAHRHNRGIGFVFDDANPFSGIDLDTCRDPQTGAIAAWAHGIIKSLDSYTEVSPSGTGVKIFLAAKLAGTGRRRGPVEIYSRRRFFTVTGQRLDRCPVDVMPRQPQLDALMARLFPPIEPSPVRPRAGGLALDDDQVIGRAMRARNGERFRRLWAGEWQALGYCSQSEADAALAAMLGYWCDYDPVRVDGLFRQSGLCRPKWTERTDYRERTLARVLH